MYIGESVLAGDSFTLTARLRNVRGWMASLVVSATVAAEQSRPLDAPGYIFSVNEHTFDFVGREHVVALAAQLRAAAEKLEASIAERDKQAEGKQLSFDFGRDRSNK